MIDTHVHAAIDFTPEAAEENLRSCPAAKMLLSASPLDHWGTALTDGCARLVRQHPDRLAGLIGIHPPDLDGSRRAIDRYGREGFIGLKLMPTSGYYVDDEVYRPIFEEANARGWILLTHVGWCSTGCRTPDLPQSTLYSDPYRFEPLIRLYPKIDFIFAHGGGRTYHTHAFELAQYHANVYIDTCPGQGIWVLRHAAPEWFDVLDAGKLLFGTDSFLGQSDFTARQENLARTVREILSAGPYADRIEDILHHNAAALLRRHGVPA